MESQVSAAVPMGRPEDVADPARMKEVTPDGPEIQRELTVIRGTVSSVKSAVGELEAMLGPVMGEDRDANLARPMESPPEVSSPIGQELRNIWYELSSLEERIHAVRNRVCL